MSRRTHLPVRGTDINSYSEEPSFIITIDTEGDNAWSCPSEVSTKNSAFLPRFQTLCELFEFKPTYLTNFEMASCPVFLEFGRDILSRHAGEIGMHLHAWNSPPLVALTNNDSQHCPYLIEYPEAVMREKTRRLTEMLEESFQVKMTSHRAGRWGFNEAYARLLIDFGYQVDCSVTPHISWKKKMGDPSRSGGSDYSDFPELPYFLDLADIRKEGSSNLLEVPVTVVERESRLGWTIGRHLRQSPSTRPIWEKLFVSRRWLRPTGKNLKQLLKIVETATRERRTCLVFVLHSTELMPGGSPYFRDAGSIELLYTDLFQLFETIALTFKGATLSEFNQRFRMRNGCLTGHVRSN